MIGDQERLIGDRPEPAHRPLRIAYLITRSDSVGGAAIHVRDLSSALQRSGHEVVVLTGGEGPYTEMLAEHQIPYRPLRHLDRPIRPWRDARALLEIRAALRRLRPSLLSTHSSKAGLLGRVAARTTGVPVIFTAHGWSFAEGVAPIQAALYRWIERATAPLADRIISVSNCDHQLAVRHGIGPADALVTVHNGMPDIPRLLRADPFRDPPRLVMVARLAAQKDHPTLFRALAGLRDHAWSLDLVGDGSRRAELEALARGLGISHRLRFLGSRHDVPEILRDSHCLLLISNWEGFPRSILEGMRAGLPIVASDVGGVRESVVDGETGFIVPRGESEVLRERLRWLLADPTLRARFGAAARLRYEREFTFEHMAERTIAVYRDVLERRAASG